MDHTDKHDHNNAGWILPLRTLGFILAGYLIFLILRMTDPAAEMHDVRRWWFYQTIPVNLLTLYFFFRNREQLQIYSRLRELGRDFRLGNLVLNFVLFAILSLGGLMGACWLLYGNLQEATLLNQPLPLPAALIALLLFPALQAVTELPFYFLYGYPALAGRTGKKGFALAYVVFFLAIQHGAIPLSPDAKFILFRALAFLPLAVFVGISWTKSRSAFSLVIVHFIMNFIAAATVLSESLAVNP